MENKKFLLLNSQQFLKKMNMTSSSNRAPSTGTKWPNTGQKPNLFSLQEKLKAGANLLCECVGWIPRISVPRKSHQNFEKPTDFNFSSFCGVVSDIPKGALLDHYHYQSPMISPTAHNAFVKGFGPYVPYSVGCDIFLHPNASSENVEIWPAMTAR